MLDCLGVCGLGFGVNFKDMNSEFSPLPAPMNIEFRI